MAGNTTRSELEADLIAVTSNYSWTWDRRTQLLFSRFPDYTKHLHPRRRVLAFTDADYDRYLDDKSFVLQTEEALARLPVPERLPNAQIAYFSPEFGITETLPQYSGGLGVLAGDHL